MRSRTVECLRVVLAMAILWANRTAAAVSCDYVVLRQSHDRRIDKASSSHGACPGESLRTRLRAS